MHCCEHDHNKHEEAQAPQEGGVYTCPMHPEVRRDKPGMCPECGMNLIKIQNAKIKMTMQNLKLKLKLSH